MNITKFLRQKAEELLKKKQSEPVPQLSESERLKFMHELEVHQIELEMINDELILANKRAAELATNKYVELYDFSPSGYFTLSKVGAIIGANLFGAQLLGRARSNAKNSLFKDYISSDTIETFNNFLEKVFITKIRQTCDVAISTKDKLPIYVQLAGIADQNGNQCLVTAVDITELKLAERNLLVANQELTFQNGEKTKRADELLIANQELAFQNEEKAKRADELLIANIELAFQTDEKTKRAAELIFAQKEIAFQAELLVANSYLESLIDNANAPIIIWDPQLRITRFNLAFELLTGRKEVDVLGQPIEILFPQKLAANTMAQIRKTQSGEKLEAIEMEIQHSDGSVRVLLWNSATIFESDDKHR